MKAGTVFKNFLSSIIYLTLHGIADRAAIHHGRYFTSAEGNRISVNRSLNLCTAIYNGCCTRWRQSAV